MVGDPSSDPAVLPANLPRPVDDGAAAHLTGMSVPLVHLRSTDGDDVDLSALGDGRTVLFVYPMTATPGVPLPTGWDDVPGARGCTAQACSMRDHLADLRAAGADVVLGMSSQSPAAQLEAHDRLHLPYPLVSDEDRRAATALRLPTFELHGSTYLRRLTLVVRSGIVEKVFYPVFPPDQHAQAVAGWLRSRS